MRGKLWGVHALYGSDAVAERAAEVYAQWVLKHMRATRQPIKKEVGGGIAGAFVIAQAAFPFVAA